MRGAVVEFLVWWAALTGIALVSISAVDPVELLVAGAAAAGAAAVAVRMRRAAGVRVRGASGALRTCAALPFAAVAGLGTLVRVMARPAGREGRIRRVRLRGGADPGWAGAALGWSADTCVVDLSEPRDPPGGPAEAVVHTFRDSPGGPERAVARPEDTR
ncbi:hypothetical protein ACFTWH_30480 [Streptomyces sp. NPDC057011]|uniref:hypothetical protein n=1 Tax=unclassified Streptomyces TaxID=2593676 RepID=UPI0036296CDC